ncbi:MAG: EAL domain-containing protein [Gemmatimonadaceae bacterium]|nr:EAL domain-containing protein [Gemmatimonadaceae bacterium]
MRVHSGSTTAPPGNLGHHHDVVVRDSGFPPERFEVEITESALMSDVDMARRTILLLKRHGIRVALDDFGTGYSSLSHLSELPFDRIKIDRSFIRALDAREESAMIVNAIIGLGKSLKLPTTAEGIESLADAEHLAALGCSVGQGFWYSLPMPGDEVPAFLTRHHHALYCASE